MSYAIISFGAIGQALARAFARKNIEVSVATRQPSEAIAPPTERASSIWARRSMTLEYQGLRSARS
jgi:8-hydroxy-5-deazaflavin:NADPH oxidoreductase